MAQFERDPEQIWKTDFLGKALHEIIQEGISGKRSGWKLPNRNCRRL